MHVYILFSHPSNNSFNKEVLDTFIKGLNKAGHTYELNDLYRSHFESEMDLEQYDREVCMDPEAPLPEDVKAEHAKIDRADVLVFIYPVWWSDCPAKLKGWFDRVLTHGYAYYYTETEMRLSKMSAEKALVICSAGHPVDHLEEIGIAQSMRTIMLNDRLLGVGVKQAHMEILGGIMPDDDSMKKPNLEKVYQLALDL